MNKTTFYILFVFAMICCQTNFLWAQQTGSGDTILRDLEKAEVEQVDQVFDSILPADKQLVSIKKIDSTAINKLRSDEEFWYVNMVPPQKKYVAPAKRSRGFSNLVWVLIIGGFVAFLIWFILSSNIQLFRRQPLEKTNDAALGDEVELDNADLEKEISIAIHAGNYRLATRLLYLQTLRILSERNLIQYKQQRTNADYLTQLYGTHYYPNFLRLTRHFEYSWYGQFDLPENKFKQINRDFLTFKNQVS